VLSTVRGKLQVTCIARHPAVPNPRKHMFMTITSRSIGWLLFASSAEAAHTSVQNLATVYVQQGGCYLQQCVAGVSRAKVPGLSCCDGTGAAAASVSAHTSAEGLLRTEAVRLRIDHMLPS
jgi:hypothetical protein